MFRLVEFKSLYCISKSILINKITYILLNIFLKNKKVKLVEFKLQLKGIVNQINLPPIEYFLNKILSLNSLSKS